MVAAKASSEMCARNGDESAESTLNAGLGFGIAKSRRTDYPVTCSNSTEPSEIGCIYVWALVVTVQGVRENSRPVDACVEALDQRLRCHAVALR